MTMLRRHWGAGLAGLTAVFLAVLGVAVFLSPGEGEHRVFVFWGTMSLLSAARLAHELRPAR